MQLNKLKIIQNKQIAVDIFQMTLAYQKTKDLKCGQFIQIQLNSCSLRKPISISSIDNHSFVIVYRVVGKGTFELSQQLPNDVLDVLMPLGNGFTIHEEPNDILIFGGGIGIPPLYEVAKKYRSQHCRVNVYLGFNCAEEAFYINEFDELGCVLYVASMDGSIGEKGNVLDLYQKFPHEYDYVYACGPTGMLKAIQENFTKGYISIEAYMACGFGVCNGCVCHDKNDSNKHYHICSDGPVFEIGKVEL